MPVNSLAADEYFRSAQQQQQLYAFWFAAGDLRRSELALNVANWYYQQIGMPYFTPANDPHYVPRPIDPDTAAAIADSLPITAGTNVTEVGAGTVTGAGSQVAAGYDDLTRSLPNQGRAVTGSGDDGALVTSAVRALDYGGFQDPTADYCWWYPDDPICYGYGFGDYPGGGGGDPITIVNQPITVVINQQGLSLGTVASMIKGALGAAAAAIATATDQVVAAAMSGIQKALNAIGNALQQVFGELARLAGLILKFLQGLLLDIVHLLVTAVGKIAAMLKDVLQNGIVPILNALQKARNYLIHLYERFFRPLLVFVQDVRQVLAILKAFHIRFATKLDGILADIQSKISTPLLYLLKYTNQLANYLNLILTFNYLIQKPLFLNSLNAYMGSALALQINAMNPAPDPADLKALQSAAAIPTPKQASAALDQYLADRTGAYSGLLTEQSSQLDQYLAQGLQ